MRTRQIFGGYTALTFEAYTYVLILIIFIPKFIRLSLTIRISILQV